VNVIAISDPAMVFPPGRLLRVAKQIRSSDMTMVPSLGAAHAAEKFLGPIRASAVETIGFFVIDNTTSPGSTFI
jgi:hypothetical protein